MLVKSNIPDVDLRESPTSKIYLDTRLYPNITVQYIDPLLEGQNIDTVKFDDIHGGFINSPSAPLSSFVFDMTDAKNAGVVEAYYKGAVLTKSSFTGLPSGATIVFFNGQNELNVLCGVFVVYDKGNNCFSVNIMTGFTGDLPSDGTNQAPNQLTITGAEVVTPNEAPSTLTITEAVTV